MSVNEDTVPWVEVIRGLGLGGAETLLSLRLASDAPSRTVRVINTAVVHDHYEGIIKGTGIEVVSMAGRHVGALLRHARRTPPDAVLLVHSPIPALWLKLARCVGLVHRPLVQVVHSSKYRPAHLIAGRLTNWLADGAVAVSKDVEASESCSGFRRTEVVLGGVDVEEMSAFVAAVPDLGDRVRAEFGVPPNAVLLCTVGTLFERKGHADLIDALADPRLERVHLLVVGDGPERDRLRNRATGHGIAHRVHFAGRRSRAWQLMAGTDGLCHTSYAEGLPVALMEALSLGLPILTTAFSGAVEVQSCSDSFTVVPVGDVNAIRASLLDHETTFMRPDVAAQDRARKLWSVRRYAEDLARAVAVLTSRPQGPQRDGGFDG